jgi:creatinine amidohydrolase/Fe(II)-dependent formamide hydrolase-like protein
VTSPPATRRLEYMRGPAVAEYLARHAGDGGAAILPIGPTEAHGLHLPEGCDHLIALATAQLAAEKADAVVLPPFSYSWPGATARLPGTIRLAPDLVVQVLIAILESAHERGFRRLAMVCAHGPDVHTGGMAARLCGERLETPIALHHAVPGRGTTARERELAASEDPVEREDRGFGETSRLIAALEILGLPPDLVDMSQGKAEGSPPPSALRESMRTGGAGFFYSELPQHIPTPGHHSIPVGRAYLEAVADAIADSLDAMRELGR